MEPKISFVTPTKETDFRVLGLLRSIRAQNYPQDKIEILIVDGGSIPEVLIQCEQYGCRFFQNPKILAEGAGMGKDQGIWNATGEFIVIAESDIELIGDNWIRNMLKPFEENQDVFASVPRFYVNPQDNITNRYFSYIGVDPFAVYRSLEGQMELNPHFTKVPKSGYDLVELNPDNPLCMGSNGFMFRKSLTQAVGDYVQDVEFIARIAQHGFKRFALVENARVWHKNVSNFRGFLRKRIRWGQMYSSIYAAEKKHFRWVTDRKAFLWHVVKSLLLLPAAVVSIRKALLYRDRAWLLHAPLLFLTTIIYIWYSLFSRRMLHQIFRG